MVCAPVIIPTMCRDQHFIRLIESLKKNSWAKDTDIYISVDFPPNDSYLDGYKKILEFLKAEFLEFHSFNVIIQKENLKPYGNTNFLIDWIKKEGHNKYIFLEDDNEVSLNFLEYMNKGLVKFANDKNVIAVCANESVIITNEKMDHGQGNYRFSRNITYGMAVDLRKWEDISQKCQNGFFFDVSKNVFLMGKLFIKDIALYRRFVVDLLYENDFYYHNGKLYPIDTVVDIYNVLFDKYVVIPNVSKIRNYGFDGSGAGGVFDETVSNGFEQRLDTESTFEFDSHIPYIDEHEAKLYSKLIRGNTIKLFIYPVMHILYVVAGKTSAIRLKKKLEKIVKKIF